ncbi:hypothetical protein ACSAZL_08475 [Methanosarcina sp. T3]|uniref:hypothetical protein n=1 Tax=Methanosarcina sp. T3 TaxID=3439062 RepID=UPI003F862FE1
MRLDDKRASGYPSIGGFTILMRSRVERLTITKGIDFDTAEVDIQKGNETEEPEASGNRNSLLSIGTVTAGLPARGIILKSMKK